MHCSVRGLSSQAPVLEAIVDTSTLTIATRMGSQHTLCGSMLSIVQRCSQRRHQRTITVS
jgi:hypothetical protein